MIKILRLTTGEELICDIADDCEPKHVTISDVAILIPTQEGNIGLAPYLPYASYESIKIPEHCVMFIVDAVDGLKQQYMSAFGKIVAPSSKIIV
jgi:hypothetical protein